MTPQPSVEQASPERAAQLLRAGWLGLDVRTEEEYAQHHIAGCFNVPLLFAQGEELVPNVHFIPTLLAAFARHEPLLLVCRSGARSQHAAELLGAHGYTVANLAHGLEGSRDAFGRRLPGWIASGQPVEQGAPAGYRYADARRRAAREP